MKAITVGQIKNVLKKFTNRTDAKMILTPTKLYLTGYKGYPVTDDTRIVYSLNLSDLRKAVKHELKDKDFGGTIDSFQTEISGQYRDQTEMIDTSFIVNRSEGYTDYYGNKVPAMLHIGCQEFTNAQANDILQAAGVIDVDKNTKVGAALAAKKTARKRAARKAAKKNK